MNYVYPIISEKEKCFVWFVARTGSNHMVSILKNFDFRHYVSYDGQKPEIFDTLLQSVHNYTFFNGHENYKFMISIRNPYSLEVSAFRMNKIKRDDFKVKFKEYLDNKYNSTINGYKSIIDLRTRIPDYYVRMEHMYEDYCKIPFIVESDYFKSGKLEEQVKIKINLNTFDDTDWREFYDDSTADTVYYNNLRIFDTFGYKKKSYKK